MAQKEPMETARCFKLEQHRRRSSHFCNPPGAYSSAHVLCKVVQSVPERNPFTLQDLVSAMFWLQRTARSFHSTTIETPKFQPGNACSSCFAIHAKDCSDIKKTFGKPLSTKLQRSCACHLLTGHRHVQTFR